MKHRYQVICDGQACFDGVKIPLSLDDALQSAIRQSLPRGKGRGAGRRCFVVDRQTMKPVASATCGAGRKW